MINEIQEFLDYTTPIKYTAESKSDTPYLRHFTLDFFTSFDGLNRVLTIIARGYLFQNGEPDIDRAKRALLAWSSIPESKKATPKKEWQYRTDFREQHGEFPELVDKNGKGWFYRHAHGVEKFILKNTEQIDSRKVPQAEKIRKNFDSQWRTKVEQLQNSVFNPNTKGGWVFRFDDAIADALGARPREVWRARDLLCVFDDPKVIEEMHPDLDKLRGLKGALMQVTAPGGDTGYDCVSRTFGPKVGMDEDPVCGSGHCHIIPYWAAQTGKAEFTARQASPRGGTLYCRKEGDRVFLAGRAILYAVCQLMTEEERT